MPELKKTPKPFLYLKSHIGGSSGELKKLWFFLLCGFLNINN